jgi:hypothetical protein
MTMSRLPAEVEGAGPELSPAEQRIARSRADLAAIIAPDETVFPRSQTMRFLMGGKGKLVAVGVFTGLLLVKPRLAVGLARFLPLGKLLPIGRVLETLR